MSSTTSSATATVSSTAAAATTTTACSTNLYDTPSRDANCAISYGGNHTDIMAACCGAADVISYYDNCGLYCLAIDQTVQDLTDCLFAQGAAYQDVFCVGSTNATATGSDSLPTSAQASVVAGTGTADTTATSKSSGSATSGASSTSSSSAANGRPQASVGKLGLAIGTLLFSATMFGALQI